MSSTAIFSPLFCLITTESIFLPQRSYSLLPASWKLIFHRFLCLLGPHFSSLHQFLLEEALPDFPKYYSSLFHILFTIWEKMSIYPSTYLIIYLPANIPTLCNFPHNWGRKPMKKKNLCFFFKSISQASRTVKIYLFRGGNLSRWEKKKGEFQ